MVVSLPAYHLTIINVKDPLNPFVIDDIGAGRKIHDLSFKNDYLFSAEGFDGLKIYKIVSPPFQVNFIDSVTFALLIENDFLFINLESFSIYDISNPENPISLGSTFLPGSRSRMEISKSQNFISLAYNQHLEIINVLNPYSPYITAYSRDDRYTSVASVNNLIFAGNEHRGIKVFKNDLITSVGNSSETKINSMNLFQNYPNPFNPITQIKYSIVEDGLVTLRAYDILGREVATLVNEEKQVGTYSINFNASNLASGVYFYQLRVGDFVQTRKMVLTK